MTNLYGAEPEPFSLGLLLSLSFCFADAHAPALVLNFGQDVTSQIAVTAPLTLGDECTHAACALACHFVSFLLLMLFKQARRARSRPAQSPTAP